MSDEKTLVMQSETTGRSNPMWNRLRGWAKHLRGTVMDLPLEDQDRMQACFEEAASLIESQAAQIAKLQQQYDEAPTDIIL